MPYKFFCAVQNVRSETVHGSDYALGFCSVRVSKINRNLEEFSGLHTSSTRFLESALGRCYGLSFFLFFLCCFVDLFISLCFAGFELF